MITNCVFLLFPELKRDVICTLAPQPVGGALKLWTSGDTWFHECVIYGVSSLNCIPRDLTQFSNGTIQLSSAGSSHDTDETFPQFLILFRIHKESHGLCFLFKHIWGFLQKGGDKLFQTLHFLHVCSGNKCFVRALLQNREDPLGVGLLFRGIWLPPLPASPCALQLHVKFSSCDNLSASSSNSSVEVLNMC